MISLKVQTTVEKSQAEVYEFVVTNYIQNHPRWDPRVVRSQLSSPGDIAVGAERVEVRKQMGREMTYEFRVTELSSDHVSFDAIGTGTRLGATWQVTPSGEASTLTIAFDLEMKGPMRLFEPLMRGGVQKEMEQAAANIKRLLDRGPPTTS